MTGHWGWMAGILIGLLILVVGVILLAVYVMRRQGPGGGSRDSAIEVLQKRYAAGEISQEEYETRKRDLGA